MPSSDSHPMSTQVEFYAPWCVPVVLCANSWQLEVCNTLCLLNGVWLMDILIQVWAL